MSVEKYWPGSLTWEQISATINALPADRFGHEEASVVQQIAGLLGVFGFPKEKRVSTQEEAHPKLIIPSAEQMRLIARLLDGLCRANAYEPHLLMGTFDCGRCRYCGSIGQLTDKGVRHDHTDDCLLALNDQLQKSLQGDVLTSRNTEEET